MDPTNSTAALYDASRGPFDRLHDVNSKRSKSGSTASSGKIRLEHYYNTYVNRMIDAGSHPDSIQIMGFEDFCATYIQDWWRKIKEDEREVNEIMENIESQSTVKKEKTLREKYSDASRVIQRAWRKHIDVQVFKYYRDLINFKQKGDPAQMLKCINPSEAKLIDMAAGVHIRFRLAGERFPPNIYYKIFTHRPVQDMCANSPKDYTAAYTKQRMSLDIHNKLNRTPAQTTDGWYMRSENNGWRLVSDRLLSHISADPVTWKTSNQRAEFHHNRLVRREDIEKKKRQKKIEWMRTMYKEGMLQAKVSDKETINLIEGAAAGMVATVDAHGPGAVQDWEVDELLDWTTGLNFDEYWSGWKVIATSDGSDAHKYRSSEECHSLYKASPNDGMEKSCYAAVGDDPYEMTLSQHSVESRRASNGGRSQNTPVSNLSNNNITAVTSESVSVSNIEATSSRSAVSSY